MMNRSLERHLARTLGLVTVIVGLAAGAVSFIFAYQEAREYQDDTLRQIAVLTDADQDADQLDAGQRSPNIIDTPGNVVRDPENQVIVAHLSNGEVPSSVAWLPPRIRPGLHTVISPQGAWRVFVSQVQPGERVVVAQKTEVRDEAAGDSALRTLVPLGVLLPLLVWLITRIVRNEFVPVRLLAQKLDEQLPERLTTLPDAGLPFEITPFVHSINSLLRRIVGLMGEQRRFIAEAAHELRSPLTALSLQAQNLEKAETLEAMRERVLPLQAGIERARRLTEQLLNLARSQATLSAPGTVDVSQMARELIAEYLPVAEARGIDLGLEGPENTSLFADPYALRLVLNNALDNALCYTPPSGEVTVRVYTENDDIVIEVCDSGPGIAPAERERVFEPFYRIEGSGGEGSGLGLAIARDAAARLGGAVSLHDRPDGPGLVFRYRQRYI